ncbi:hypothetical protein ANACOL_04125 [Anaerotruncus colihominis DSM 17241]|uniref:Uncharacterized protein n=1 Tax=Anaerotruncus colihominis DSM 17241 TaxID=445972 RepID=B0PHA3_9FIRM|nr:hypothetical protein ANACOL_04125 [Anaerotruncus colihominis DSM 17241]
MRCALQINMRAKWAGPGAAVLIAPARGRRTLKSPGLKTLAALSCAQYNRKNGSFCL